MPRYSYRLYDIQSGLKSVILGITRRQRWRFLLQAAHNLASRKIPALAADYTGYTFSHAFAVVIEPVPAFPVGYVFSRACNWQHVSRFYHWRLSLLYIF